MTKEKSYKIGKSRSCDIVLADDTVSGRHAEIVIYQDGKILLTDTKSKNGTYLFKGKKFEQISQERITPTDIVKFGLCEIAVKDLLEFLHLRTILPNYNPTEEKKLKMDGKVLLRCTLCGSPKKPGQPCTVCGGDTRSYHE